MHSVANLATLQTPLAIFSPSKKRPDLVSETRHTARARGPALPARAHTSLSLSLCVCLVSLPARAHTSLSLSLSLSLCVCLVSLPARAHTSLSLCIWLSFCTARGREEQRFNSVKHRYYVASLILHASIAEITAQLLSLSYVYLISSEDGAIIMILCVQINILEGRAGYVL